MAVNLRLRPDAEEALRREGERSHRSQQEVLRAAVDRYLGLDDPAASAVHDLIATGRVRPPRSPYRKVRPRESSEVPSLELLDRADRL
ncbi:MAG: hypothetical protein H7Y15_00265 [Pseudonocardia sp.]|nr:hypothetical protein [Pseudonocardia sp.]